MTNEKRDRVTKAQSKKDTESAKKTKRILETAGEVFSVKKGITIVLYLLKPLRLCGWKQV